MTEPPTGYPPPVTAQLHDGQTLDLRVLAEEICARYRAEFPDEQERYGDVGMAWCVHDNQHIVNWAVTERNGYGGLKRQVAWLARVLEAREFPLERLTRNLEIAAAVLSEALPHDASVSEPLLNAARFVRSQPTFLGESD